MCRINTQVMYDIGREDRQRPAARGGADAGAYLSPPLDLLDMYDRVYREAGARVLLNIFIYTHGHVYVHTCMYTHVHI